MYRDWTKYKITWDGMDVWDSCTVVIGLTSNIYSTHHQDNQIEIICLCEIGVMIQIM